MPSYEEVTQRAGSLQAMTGLDLIKVCSVSWPNNLSPSDGGLYAKL
jgi:hypothetical protein